jgi:hypothetical protein
MNCCLDIYRRRVETAFSRIFRFGARFESHIFAIAGLTVFFLIVTAIRPPIS